MRQKVTQEQIETARQIGTLEYLQRFEPDELTTTYHANGREMRCKHGEFRTKTHDSLSITENKFYWWSRGIGGNSALDYLVKVKDVPFQQAVLQLAGDAAPAIQAAAPVQQPAEVQPQAEKPFQLPERAENHRRVFAYLTKSRGIEREIVQHCLDQKLLYEDAAHHNAVFVGYDGNEARFASMRSTLTGSGWRMDQPGSDKRFSFRMNPGKERLLVFEAPIDAMSMASLFKLQGKDWKAVSYLALGGIAPKALLHYLETDPQVKQITLALDGDKAGRSNAEKIRSAVLERFPQVKANSIHPAAQQGKDWNDVLLFKRNEGQLVDKPPPALQSTLADATKKARQRNETQLSNVHTVQKTAEASLGGI